MRPFVFLVFALLGPAIPLACGDPAVRIEPQLRVSHAGVVPRLLAEANDPAWRGPESGVELQSLNDASASGHDKAGISTSVELLWDAQCFYVRFWCRSPVAPWSPYGNQRDAPHYEGDVVEVFIDPVGDARQFAEIQVSAGNGVFDKLYLLTSEARNDADGLLQTDLLRRDQWEFAEWNWEGLRSATHEWRKGDVLLGWITDIALPAKPFLRRLDLNAYQPGMVLRAHLLRNSSPEDPAALSGRTFLSWSWVPVIPGRPHRAPFRMGALILAP